MSQPDLFDVGERSEPGAPGGFENRRGLPENYPLGAQPTPDRPGTGPVGETCKTCLHYCRVRYRDKLYRKCGAIEFRWTHGPGTDICASWPACSSWEQPYGYTPLDLCPPGFPLAEAKAAPLVAADWWEENNYPEKAALLRKLAGQEATS